jgi:hypothetical protein
LITVKRLSVLLAEVAFAIALVVAIGFAAAYHKRILFFEILIVLQTLVIFGYVVKQFRPYWRNPRFWWWLSALFLCHLGGVALVFEYRENLNAAAIGLLAFLEYMTICALLDRLLFWSDSSKTWSR